MLSTSEMMNSMQTGLVSITLRNVDPAGIISLCVRNGLDAVEWGGDVHVPHGDLEAAKTVGNATRNAGLHIQAYGSYYRLGQSHEDGLSFQTVLSTAQALGAPAIRVWAGTQHSASATSGYRQSIADEALKIADQAHAAGILICYECHSGTLTDTTPSMLDLLERTRHPAIRTLWQPYNGQDAETCREGLRAVLSWVYHAHVFHWFPNSKSRWPLQDGFDHWKQYLPLLSSVNTPLLLEFVKDNDWHQLEKDARTLNQWITSSA